MQETHSHEHFRNAILIESMVIAHFDEVLALWRHSEGIGLSSADSRENISRYLERNPNLSLVALLDGEIVGAMLCGHDGRRGYIHHLAVAENHHRREIGRLLVTQGLKRLRIEGIDKCHLFVFRDNVGAIRFWTKLGFTERVDLSMMSKMNSQESEIPNRNVLINES